MIVQALAFYLFAAVCVASGAMVVASRNPVHSVLYLIVAFFNAAGLFVLMGAEFLAMLLVVVYVGAVAVLFLFVVMMLDVDFAELRAGTMRYLPVGGAVGLILLAELTLAVTGWLFSSDVGQSFGAKTPGDVTNAHALGRILYTDYLLLFQAAGLVLLVAMIGAIVLTLRRREGVKRQRIDRQVHRRREESLTVVKVSTGKGV